MKPSISAARLPRLLSLGLERTEVEVPSTTLATRRYRVVWVGAGAPRCTCPGYASHKHCKHGRLAAAWLFGEAGYRQSLALLDAQLEVLRAAPLPPESDSPAFYLGRALQAVRDEIAARLAALERDAAARDGEMPDGEMPDGEMPPVELDGEDMAAEGAVLTPCRNRHTAGPLVVSELRDCLFIEAGDGAGRLRCVAKLPRAALGGGESEVAEQVANARLFAAAPELFECLEAVGETFAVWAADNSLSSAERALWERVESVLERARGEPVGDFSRDKHR